MSHGEWGPQPVQASMYCRACRYVLDGLSSTRCPECGSPFDPSDATTFLSTPASQFPVPRRWWAIIVFTGTMVLSLVPPVGEALFYRPFIVQYPFLMPVACGLGFAGCQRVGQAGRMLASVSLFAACLLLTLVAYYVFFSHA